MTLHLIMSYIIIFGQTESPVTGDVVAVGSAVSQMGFLGFIVWYLLSKALPALQEKFSHDLDKLTDRHTQSLVDLKEGMRALIDLARAPNGEVLKQVQEHMRSSDGLLRELERQVRDLKEKVGNQR